jgi:transposase
MDCFVGLDVSQESTSICIVDADGSRVWEGKTRSDPESIAGALASRVPRSAPVGLETGPLSTWLWHGLRARGVSVVCLHARQAAAALKMQANKTDMNDAYGLAQITRTGWFRPVAVKSLERHRIRTLLSARAKLVSTRTALNNQIRGLLKTFGVVLGSGKGGSFERNVRAQLPEDGAVTAAVESLLAVWCEVGRQKTALEKRLRHFAARDRACRLMMTAPGVGPITAATFVSTVDDPGRFARSKDVGAYLGLTPKRYQSGEIDRAGRISKCGDRMLRTYLFEAASVILHRSRSTFPLREWALRLVRRVGLRKAKVALARRLAVILHRMWVSQAPFCFFPASTPEPA